MRPLVLGVAIVLAAGCGQKGPLYLRDSPPPGMKLPKAESYKPVPYPKEAPRESERDGAAEK
jgi:predicted small lipoprotein YifL